MQFKGQGTVQLLVYHHSTGMNRNTSSKYAQEGTVVKEVRLIMKRIHEHEYW